MDKLPHKIVFAGCARDCAPHLPSVFANLRALSQRCTQSAFVFVENDSRDDTAHLLTRFCEGQALARLLRLDGIGAAIPARTVRLAMARNAIVSVLRHWPAVRDFDTLVMLDLDAVNERPWSLDVMCDALTSVHRGDDLVAVFANQLHSHYDLWALREPELCPGDVWEDAFDLAETDGLDDQAAFERAVQARAFCLPPDSPALSVESAFGGLGIYRLSAVRANPLPYCGEATKVAQHATPWRTLRWQRCEHVNFHAGLRLAGGRLVIRPDLINADGADMGFNPSAFRSLSF